MSALAVQIAGENALGGQASFAGSLGTQVVKVFDLAVARTGIRDAEAAEAGHDPVTVGSEEFDHTAYYPGARRLRLRATGDRTTGRLLGRRWSVITAPRWPSASTSSPPPCSAREHAGTGTTGAVCLHPQHRAQHRRRRPAQRPQASRRHSRLDRH
jgi:hypothetical protein